MQVDKFKMFRNRLNKVYKHIGKQARRLNVSCYRLYDHDLPEFPFSIEFYSDKLYVAEYRRRHGMEEAEHDDWLEKSRSVISEELHVPVENIFIKLRQRKQGRKGQYQKLGSEKDEFIVEENGLRFLVNLTDYLDTGLFLDHRDTRKMVKEMSAGKRVLNLFSYTGSFSVYAASGGATGVTTVDLSNTYLSWAKRNMELNGFAESKYSYQQADVMEYLKTVPSSSFHLIVMDPPTFSNSKRMDDILEIQRDHVPLINECLRILANEGKLIFSTNFTQFKMDTDKLLPSTVKDITRATTPFDFEGRLARFCYLVTRNNASSKENNRP